MPARVTAAEEGTSGVGRSRSVRLPVGVLDEVGWQGERPDVAGFPGAGSVADEGFGRQQLCTLPIEKDAIVVTVETQGDGCEPEGMREGFWKVPAGAEAPVVVVAVFADPPDAGDRRGEVGNGALVVVGALGHGCLLRGLGSEKHCALVGDAAASIT